VPAGLGQSPQSCPIKAGQVRNSDVHGEMQVEVDDFKKVRLAVQDLRGKPA
jgi:hypothetical protein